MRHIIIGLVIGAIGATSALAQDMPAYLDDRSTPESLVNSYYNAINRQEYSRAYTYFATGEAAGHAYADYAKGFADTASVTVATGSATSDAGMSKVQYALPVAIDAVDSKGNHSQFAGCFKLQLTQPGVQDPPVTPMQIVAAHLEPAKGEIASLLPSSCAD